MDKARFNLWVCNNCNTSINTKKDLNLFPTNLDDVIVCCDRPELICAYVSRTDIVWLESEADGYVIRHHIKAFTYEPKIKGVLDGSIKQTIRPSGKVPVKRGDTIRFHGWEGRPYFSKWSWQIRVKVSRVNNIKMLHHGILEGGIFFRWESLNLVAEADGIEQKEGMNHGESMGVLFNKMYRKELNENEMKGIDMQIIHWDEIEWITNEGDGSE